MQHIPSINPLIMRSILLCIFLTGCNVISKTQTSERIFKIEPVSDKNQAGLYIYRPPAMANGLYSTQINVDRKNHFEVNSGQLKYIQLPTGQHQITLQTAVKFTGNHVSRLDMQAGKTYFLRIVTTLNLATGDNYQPYRRTFNLQKVGENTAIEEITRCCFSSKKPDITTSANPDIQPQRKKAAFSVDKTADPFSHK